jgi:hypothetical protein
MSPPSSFDLQLSTKHATSSLLPLCLSLHLLRNLDIDLEELAHASVQTYGFALVEVPFAVGGIDAFFAAGLYESVSWSETC